MIAPRCTGTTRSKQLGGFPNADAYELKNHCSDPEGGFMADFAIVPERMALVNVDMQNKPDRTCAVSAVAQEKVSCGREHTRSGLRWGVRRLARHSVADVRGWA
jgi:hypothetical protein